jgi:hypothetical protein
MRTIIKKHAFLLLAVLAFVFIFGACSKPLRYKLDVTYINETPYDVKLEFFRTSDLSDEPYLSFTVLAGTSYTAQGYTTYDGGTTSYFGSVRMTFSDGVITEFLESQYDQLTDLYGEHNILRDLSYDFIDDKTYFTITNDLHDKHL